MKLYQQTKAPGFFFVLRRVAVYAFKVSPPMFLLFIVYNIVNGVLTGLYAPFLQQFLDTATGGNSFGAIIASLLAFAAILIGEHIVNGVDHSLTGDLHARLRGNAWGKVCEKAGKLPTEWFENPEFLTHLEKAKEGARYDWTFFIPLFRFIVTYVPASVVMGAYLYSLEPRLTWIMLFLYVPTIFSYGMRSGVLSKLEDEAAPIRREREHYSDCISSPEFFKETRVLGAHSFFREKHVNATLRLLDASLRAFRTTNRIDMITGILTLLGYGGILGLLLFFLLSGQITAGAFAAVFATAGYFFGLADETLGHLMAPVSGIATVRHFVSFLDLPEAEMPLDSGEAPGSVSAEKISFRYAGGERAAVSGLSISLTPGETVAIVGLNGSGKTTLVRLLTGLYTPDEGQVHRAGRASAVFQKYQRYRMTLKENVAISDRAAPPDERVVLECAKSGGIALDDETYSDGINTMLSREFDGVDLSGGQWQRVAIARGLYRASDVIVLDEPTAAIDPIEETRLYEQFADLAEGRTAILVTHRLGSARIADRIFVMDAGNIVDCGTHDELIARGGLYRQMYEAQKKWYERDQQII